MADLIAQGMNPRDQWRRTFPPNTVTLGRDPQRSDWAVPWDKKVSGRHASLTWTNGKLRVQRLPGTLNPVYLAGEPRDEFTVNGDQRFVIGETVFVLQPSEPVPVAKLTCNVQALRRFTFTDAGDRLEALAALPGLIRHSPSDHELETRVADVLLQGSPRADCARVVRLATECGMHDAEVQVRASKGRDAAAPSPPCRRLVVEAVQGRENVLHIWDTSKPDHYTVAPGRDWAICVPLLDASSLGLYVAGRISETSPHSEGPSREDLLKGDMKFAGLTAEVFSALREVRELRQQRAQLGRYFPPSVIALADGDLEEALKPREVDVTVLFCDLRGSSRVAEDEADNIPALWQRIGAALDIMAGSITDQEGVVGGFQGDGAMGFWGWPIECPDRASRAARAALIIRKRFAQATSTPGHPLGDFKCGVGVASGRAIAGRLGTPDLFKVDVFGPVVNLAARLESMTKIFGVSIVLDEHTSQLLNDASKKSVFRCRGLAQVMPYGMQHPLMINELLPPATEAGAMPDADRLDYDAALRKFLLGRWNEARELFKRLPSDNSSRFLLEHISRYPNGAPPDWQGIIQLPK